MSALNIFNKVNSIGMKIDSSTGFYSVQNEDLLDVINEIIKKKTTKIAGL